jgi:hypothetical protein
LLSVIVSSGSLGPRPFIITPALGPAQEQRKLQFVAKNVAKPPVLFGRQQSGNLH